MADVRLTATNPADSSVVPVACNEKGELLLEPVESDFLPLSGGNLSGDLTIGSTKVVFSASEGSGDFAGSIHADGMISSGTNGNIDAAGAILSTVGFGSVSCSRYGGENLVFRGRESTREVWTSTIYANGHAVFDGDVVIGSRNKQWMIVESNGLAHLVDQSIRAEDDEYPPLRDIPTELTMVEQQLQKVMERLKMAPEAGWEVWDGTD